MKIITDGSTLFTYLVKKTLLRCQTLVAARDECRIGTHSKNIRLLCENKLDLHTTSRDTVQRVSAIVKQFSFSVATKILF